MAKMLDVVKLRDGRVGTILEVYDEGQKYMIEITDRAGKTVDTPIVSNGDVVAVEYSAESTA